MAMAHHRHIHRMNTPAHPLIWSQHMSPNKGKKEVRLASTCSTVQLGENTQSRSPFTAGWKPYYIDKVVSQLGFEKAEGGGTTSTSLADKMTLMESRIRAVLFDDGPMVPGGLRRTPREPQAPGKRPGYLVKLSSRRGKT